MKRILVTGGAGFVGSALARKLKQESPEAEVVAFDNLRRRGSELNLPDFKSRGIRFVHGDIRSSGDLEDLEGEFDLFIEASAEPSVLAGVTGSPQYAIQSNLVGTLNCLELARKRAGRMVFLSTSRVYSIEPLKAIRLKEGETRLEIEEKQPVPGVSAEGVAEGFPTSTARSIYGATKLASEQMIQEYAYLYGLQAAINRCGVIAGSGQFGKVDQGVFTLWIAYHVFKRPLRYTGFGGQGKQVRDLLHPDDLYELIRLQAARMKPGTVDTYNIGGGRAGSVSLRELTSLCEQASGNRVAIASDPQTASVDVPLYISDCRKVGRELGWAPKRGPREIVEEVARWVRDNSEKLQGIL